MNIFQIKTQPEGIEKKDEFLSEGYVCIGYSDADDFSNLSRDELREKLNLVYGWESSQLGTHLGNVNAFVNTMEVDDIVLINDNEWVHIGRLGEYKFEQQYIDEGTCHRRYVKWLGKIEKYKLNEYVKELLRNRSIVTKFKHPYDVAELDKILNSLNTDSAKKDDTVIQKAVDVLIKALESKDEKIRVEAAASLLKYYK
ncbi:MAG: hypothetical protein E7211_16765 [Clostridium lundense]|nr:hypothetical protein [Clostridium lundense]